MTAAVIDVPVAAAEAGCLAAFAGLRGGSSAAAGRLPPMTALATAPVAEPATEPTAAAGKALEVARRGLAELPAALPAGAASTAGRCAPLPPLTAAMSLG